MKPKHWEGAMGFLSFVGPSSHAKFPIPAAEDLNNSHRRLIMCDAEQLLSFCWFPLPDMLSWHTGIHILPWYVHVFCKTVCKGEAKQHILWINTFMKRDSGIAQFYWKICCKIKGNWERLHIIKNENSASEREADRLKTSRIFWTSEKYNGVGWTATARDGGEIL